MVVVVVVVVAVVIIVTSMCTSHFCAGTDGMALPAGPAEGVFS